MQQNNDLINFSPKNIDYQISQKIVEQNILSEDSAKIQLCANQPPDQNYQEIQSDENILFDSSNEQQQQNITQNYQWQKLQQNNNLSSKQYELRKQNKINENIIKNYQQRRSSLLALNRIRKLNSIKDKLGPIQSDKNKKQSDTNSDKIINFSPIKLQQVSSQKIVNQLKNQNNQQQIRQFNTISSNQNFTKTQENEGNTNNKNQIVSGQIQDKKLIKNYQQLPYDNQFHKKQQHDSQNQQKVPQISELEEVLQKLKSNDLQQNQSNMDLNQNNRKIKIKNEQNIQNQIIIDQTLEIQGIEAVIFLNKPIIIGTYMSNTNIDDEINHFNLNLNNNKDNLKQQQQEPIIVIFKDLTFNFIIEDKVKLKKYKEKKRNSLFGNQNFDSEQKLNGKYLESIIQVQNPNVLLIIQDCRFNVLIKDQEPDSGFIQLKNIQQNKYINLNQNQQINREQYVIIGINMLFSQKNLKTKKTKKNQILQIRNCLFQNLDFGICIQDIKATDIEICVFEDILKTAIYIINPYKLNIVNSSFLRCSEIGISIKFTKEIDKQKLLIKKDQEDQQQNQSYNFYASEDNFFLNPMLQNSDPYRRKIVKYLTILIQQCKFYEIKKSAIQIFQKEKFIQSHVEIKIQLNQLEHILKEGIYINNLDVTALDIIGNTLIFGEIGIQLENIQNFTYGSQVLVKNNKITSFYQSGILIEDCSVILDKNLLQKNNLNGLQMINVRNCIIRNCQFIENKQNGVLLISYKINLQFLQISQDQITDTQKKMLENRQCVPILGMGPIIFSNCSFSFNKKGIVLQEQNPSIKIRPEFITQNPNTKNKNQSIFSNNTVENNKQKMLEEFLIEICQNKTLSSKKSAQMVHISQIQKKMGHQSKTIKNQFKVDKNNQGGVFLNLLNCQITENEVSGIVIIGLQGFNHHQLNASNNNQVKYFLLNQINIQNCLIKDNQKYQISFKDFKNENKIESVYPDSEYIPYIIMDENTFQVLQCEQNKNKQKTKGTCQIF